MLLDPVSNCKLYVCCIALFQESDAPGSGATTTLKLSDIAVALKSDWVPLAEHLGITEPEVIKIQTEFGSIVEQVKFGQIIPFIYFFTNHVLPVGLFGRHDSNFGSFCHHITTY